MKAMICFTHPAWVHQFHHIIWRMRERGDEVLCFVAEKDGNSALSAFADELQAATVRTIEQGVMTGDIASISTLENIKTVHAEEFIHEVRARMNV